ncbi:unnamed protein product [Eruca vesicaria subsp. sativa]|uniref:Uncharacterized protein n=1 Tax=Eruca vesicaria subsp. sativa TaxID=29727 RepID=A0ABC8LGE4_ERUVS|nr:unnamed protein product [Eruca vesicaria subsp. sativa]
MDIVVMMQRVLLGNTKQRKYLPYITSFTKEKQKEEVVKLGVELSLFVAETMFLLSDDIRSTLTGPVFGRLFRVVEYVFIAHIKPKNGIYHDGGISIHCQQSKALYPNFTSVKFLDRIVMILKNGGGVKLCGFGYCNQEVKKLAEKLGYSKDVSKANGFVREAIKCNIFQLWKPLFGTTPEVINPITRVLELYGPVGNKFNQIACCERLASLVI